MFVKYLILNRDNFGWFPYQINVKSDCYNPIRSELKSRPILLLEAQFLNRLVVTSITFSMNYIGEHILGFRISKAARTSCVTHLVFAVTLKYGN